MLASAWAGFEAVFEVHDLTRDVLQAEHGTSALGDGCNLGCDKGLTGQSEASLDLRERHPRPRLQLVFVQKDIISMRTAELCHVRGSCISFSTAASRKVVRASGVFAPCVQANASLLPPHSIVYAEGGTTILRQGVFSKSCSFGQFTAGHAQVGRSPLAAHASFARQGVHSQGDLSCPPAKQSESPWLTSLGVCAAALFQQLRGR